MKNLFLTFLTVICVAFSSSCEKATPERIFGVAVLNTNLMSGFAGSGLRYQLENPSVKLTPSGGTATMTRKEIINRQIHSIEEAYEKTKRLSESDDNREVLLASIGLYGYVLPIYRNEYRQLAELYDSNAGKAELEAAYQAISNNYLNGYQERSESLVAAGKSFAKRHGIRVTWDMQTSPSP